MQLAGLQRCSLVDYPGQPCCTVFTQGCNLRCPWCHNARLIGEYAADPIPLEAFWALLKRRQGRIRAVTVTGGEPTEHADLPTFLAEIKARGFVVKLDSNGTRPGVLEKLIREGAVDCVAMDVKAPLDARYSHAAGTSVSIESIRESIGVLKAASGIAVEFRTTVIPALHLEDDIEEIAQCLQGASCYYLQAFQPTHALSPRYRESPVPRPEFMEACRRRASQWVPTQVR